MNVKEKNMITPNIRLYQNILVCLNAHKPKPMLDGFWLWLILLVWGKERM